MCCARTAVALVVVDEGVEAHVAHDVRPEGRKPVVVEEQDPPVRVRRHRLLHAAASGQGLSQGLCMGQLVEVFPGQWWRSGGRHARGQGIC